MNRVLYCYVQIAFSPTATGTLTFYDSAPGSPHPVSLTANGLAASGLAVASPSTTTFPTTEIGSTSPVQYVYFSNPGNTPVTVTGITFPANFSYYNGYTAPFTVPAGSINQY
jgi:hypothetical protein